jgi:hypothetical protein
MRRLKQEDVRGAVSGSAGTAAANRVERVRELERFALQRLPSLQLGDGIFCHQVRAADVRPRGRSLRHTLVVLLGLLRAEEHGLEHSFHLGAMRTRMLSELDSPALTAGDLGLALWAEARGQGDAVAELLRELRIRLERGGIDGLRSAELAWAVTGLIEAGTRAELGGAEAILAHCRDQLITDRRPRGGLVTHAARGRGRRLARFDDQIFSILAMSQLARIRDDEPARKAARSVGDLLLDNQMADGGWPWIYDAIRGIVVDPYELYSVHQDSVAMIGLHGLTEATGEQRYREVAAQSLDWSYGNNELGLQMLDREAEMLYRSIGRKRQRRRSRRVRNTAAAYLRAGPRPASPDELEVDRSMRPDHLGWLLEAWAGREELARVEMPAS